MAEENLNVRDMIEKLRGVCYVSTLGHSALDPELHMFFNVNTPADLEKAMTMVKAKKRR